MLFKKKDKFESKGFKYLEKKTVEREEADPLEIVLEYLTVRGFLAKTADPFKSGSYTYKFGKLGEKMRSNLIKSWENSTAKKLSNIKFIENMGNKSGTECLIEMFDLEEVNAPFGFASVIEADTKDFNSEKFSFRSLTSKILILEYATVPSTAKDMLISWLEFIIEYFNKLGLKSEDLEIDYQTLDDHPDTDHYYFDRYQIKNIYHFGVEEFATVLNKIDFEFENYEKKFPDEKKHKCFVHDDLREIDSFPYIIQIRINVDKLLIAVLLNNFHQERIRTSIVTTLKLSPQLAPVKCAVFPLSIVDKKTRIASERLYNNFLKLFETVHDEKGTLEMRMAHYDEAGIPFYVTIDPAIVDENMFRLYDNKFGTQSELYEEDIINYMNSKINE